MGSPQTVARKIAGNPTTPGASRFDLKYRMGELYGTRVVQRMRKLLR